jgi:predicted nucleotidyltransferase
MWMDKERMKFEDNTALTLLIEKIKAIPDVLAIVVFGSYAVGNTKEMSDIDIAVIVAKADRHIEADIGSMYSPKFDVVLFHRLPLHIQYEVLKNGNVIFCRNEEHFLEITRNVLREYLEMSDMYERIKRRVLVCD